MHSRQPFGALTCDKMASGGEFWRTVHCGTYLLPELQGFVLESAGERRIFYFCAVFVFSFAHRHFAPESSQTRNGKNLEADRIRHLNLRLDVCFLETHIESWIPGTWVTAKSQVRF